MGGAGLQAGTAEEVLRPLRERSLLEAGAVLASAAIAGSGWAPAPAV